MEVERSVLLYEPSDNWIAQLSVLLCMRPSLVAEGHSSELVFYPDSIYIWNGGRIRLDCLYNHQQVFSWELGMTNKPGKLYLISVR